MRYGAVRSKDGKDALATFPGGPGLVTGGPADEILAADALVGGSNLASTGAGSLRLLVPR